MVTCWTLPLAISIIWVKVNNKKDLTELCLEGFSINETLCMKWLANRKSPINVSFLKILQLHWTDPRNSSEIHGCFPPGRPVLQLFHSNFGGISMCVLVHKIKIKLANYNFAMLLLVQFWTHFEISNLGETSWYFHQTCQRSTYSSICFLWREGRGLYYYQNKWDEWQCLDGSIS